LESPDVNVLLGAAIEDAPHHAICRDWLRTSLSSGSTIGISELVLSGVVRVATNPRAFPRPATLAAILQYTGVLLSHPTVTRLRPGDNHWRIFTGLCEREHVTGNKVSDAYHAALAIEHGATWITLDRDFASFSWLKSRNLLARPEVREPRARYGVPPIRRRAGKR
jgi:toxin-antitoxin system PIN domain toxin